MPENTHIISCRVGSDKYNRIVAVARQLNLKRSDVIKLALDDDLWKYHPINQTPKEKAQSAKMRRSALDKLGQLSTEASSLSRRWLLAGNNLNQLAHRANSEPGGFDLELSEQIAGLEAELPKEQLIGQNSTLIRRLTELWQLLE